MGAVEGPRSITCAANSIVNDEAELNDAILCYNLYTTPGVYTIEPSGNINLTASTLTIDNSTAGVSLLIDGMGWVIRVRTSPACGRSPPAPAPS